MNIAWEQAAEDREARARESESSARRVADQAQSESSHSRQHADVCNRCSH